MVLGMLGDKVKPQCCWLALAGTFQCILLTRPHATYRGRQPGLPAVLTKPRLSCDPSTAAYLGCVGIARRAFSHPPYLRMGMHANRCRMLYVFDRNMTGVHTMAPLRSGPPPQHRSFLQASSLDITPGSPSGVHSDPHMPHEDYAVSIECVCLRIACST